MGSSSSSSSDNNNSKSKQQQHHARLREEGKAVESIVNALQRRLDELRVSAAEGETFTLTEEERQRLWQYNNSGLFPGVAAGVISLVVLRRMRSSLLRRLLQQQQQQQQQRYQQTVTPPPPPTTGQGAHVQNSPFQPSLPPHMMKNANTTISSTQHQQQQRISSKLMGAVGWALDGVVSFSIAVMASVYFTDVKAIMNGLAEFPKLKGGSKIADKLCVPVLEALEELQNEQQQQQQPKQDSHSTAKGSDADFLFGDATSDTTTQVVDDSSAISNDDDDDPKLWKGQPVESPYLQSILLFAENCRQTGHRISRRDNDEESDDFYQDDKDWADALTTDQDQKKD